MRLATALRLARPAATADRGRCLLTATSTALAGALLLAAIHVVRLPADGGAGQGLARYVTESGLRAGVVIGTLLLTVPVLALTVQALRVGSVARDRRMASLRLAGATPRDARVIAALEAGGAALAGGLLAGPAYLVLWVLAGVLPPAGARMVAIPDALDLLAWAPLVPLAALAGALAGAAIHARAVVEPLGVRRRGRPQPPGRASLAVLLAGAAFVAAGVIGLTTFGIGSAAELGLLALALIGLLLCAFAGGPRFVLGCAHILGRRPGAEALLAGRRLQADPRSAGRVASVLLVCGVALGVEGLILANELRDGGFGEDDAAFYLGGFGIAAFAVLVAAVVAMLTLLVGAADGLLDARRPLATLAAVGVGERELTRVLARQLSAIAVPAVIAGALFGGPALALLASHAFNQSALRAAAWALLPGAVTAIAAGLALAVAARLAARLLRPLIRAAIDPENLRVA